MIFNSNFFDSKLWFKSDFQFKILISNTYSNINFWDFRCSYIEHFLIVKYQIFITKKIIICKKIIFTKFEYRIFRISNWKYSIYPHWQSDIVYIGYPIWIFSDILLESNRISNMLYSDIKYSINCMFRIEYSLTLAAYCYFK